ncbi:efflux RND transporter periplasmic adaptor subunit [Methylosinus sp. Sm6]|uniref:efflux RND transporter periplasmic adaptor subunit n=1 Tax=Methylosinus sp. Sm6 TaxID=2866948 RepID=UPI00351CE419
MRGARWRRRLAFGTLAVSIMLASLWLYGSLVSRSVEAKGVVAAIGATPIEARVSGRIRAVYCDRGTRVEAGRICAEIDPRPYQAIVEQSRAELSAAAGRLEQAKAVLARARMQLKRGRTRAGSIATLEQAQERLASDEDAYASRRAALREAEDDLARTKIAAPIGGTVVARDAEVGRMIGSEPRALFLISTDPGVVTISATLHDGTPEATIGSPADFVVASLPGRAFSGKVTQIARLGLGAAEAYRIIVEAPNADLLLEPGMIATIRIETREWLRRAFHSR